MDIAGTADGDRFLVDFAALSAFGATPSGGVDRQAGTDADDAQRMWLIELLREQGAQVRIDAIGNVFGTWERVPGAPFIVVGSHLDSQPRAGRYDGAYGVLAGAHACFRVAERLDAEGVEPRFNFAVVDWFNEEGARFQPSMMGSAVYTEKLDLENALAAADRRGVTVRAALGSLRSSGDAEAPAAAGYVEIHVEQGRILESEGLTIGLVEATWASRKYRVNVIGEQSHTGSTPMSERRDALLGAARLIVGVRQIADDFGIHTSVSSIDIEPNSPVVVAREAELLVDMRAAENDVLAGAERALHLLFAEVAESTSVEVRQHLEHEWQVSPYQEEGVEYAERVARSLGLGHRRMMTIAGHDSTNMKDIVPSIMLFVPSVDGIAHNEGELTEDDDLVAGLRMLTEVLRGIVVGEFDLDTASRRAADRR